MKLRLLEELDDQFSKPKSRLCQPHGAAVDKRAEIGYTILIKIDKKHLLSRQEDKQPMSKYEADVVARRMTRVEQNA